jgi:hypothetical protein
MGPTIQEVRVQVKVRCKKQKNKWEEYCIFFFSCFSGFSHFQLSSPHFVLNITSLQTAEGFDSDIMVVVIRRYIPKVSRDMDVVCFCCAKL